MARQDASESMQTQRSWTARALDFAVDVCRRFTRSIIGWNVLPEESNLESEHSLNLHTPRAWVKRIKFGTEVQLDWALTMTSLCYYDRLALCWLQPLCMFTAPLRYVSRFSSIAFQFYYERHNYSCMSIFQHIKSTVPVSVVIINKSLTRHSMTIASCVQ